ncbi:hypothetical protein MKX79_12930 [Viridibacillus sp. FSL R5-0468]|uniref:hypothetical protein n=1 Tax=Viridibacillus sp. FSL R5-0468 TaxID=2921640 RepID=UPI0030F730E2
MELTEQVSVINQRGIELFIIKMILAVFVMAISAYCFITKDYLYAPISSLLLGILIAIIGIDEFKNNGKNSRCMFFIPVSILVIVVVLFSF